RAPHREKETRPALFRDFREYGAEGRGVPFEQRASKPTKNFPPLSHIAPAGFNPVYSVYFLKAGNKYQKRKKSTATKVAVKVF
ncbi:hypothetical protein D5Y59_23065, partial [Klebsiella pneumoniae]|nr:hypothetical protein [Klebsiella pneumoniae]